MKRDGFKLVYALLSLLIVVVVAQGYFIYDLTKTSKAQTKKELIVDDFFKHPHVSGNVDPFEEIKKIQEEMQKSFGHFNSVFSNDPFFKDVYKEMSISPLSDIKEDKKNYIIELNIPGADKQQIDIKSDGNMLKVYAKNTKSTDTNETNYVHRERFTQVFERSFLLPNDADLDKMKNNYKDGILKIIIPKKLS